MQCKRPLPEQECFQCAFFFLMCKFLSSVSSRAQPSPAEICVDQFLPRFIRCAEDNLETNEGSRGHED